MTEEKKDTQELTPEEIEDLKYKARQEKEQVINKVIKGVNDTWEKEYNFKELDLNFTIKARFPNAIEQGRIFALRSSYLGGMDMYQNDDVIQAYQMLAVLQVVGEDVPKQYRDPEEVYNLYPLTVVYKDWVEFLSSFRY